MKRHYLLFKNQFIQGVAIGILAAFFSLNQVFAQVLTGVKTIPGNYSTLALAVADLNANGVGVGGVTFNIAANYTETLASGLKMTATGTATAPIIFQKSGVGANPLITSFTGGLLASSAVSVDIMWAFTGCDYVTIDGIDLIEAATNTTPTTQMEVGFGFYKVSGTDGTNNNTVKNCVITLNRNDTTAATSTGPRANAAGSVGIEVMACTQNAVGNGITVTSVSGASSNNKFYSNTIQNVNFGIALGGFAAPSPYTLADVNNDIGGNSITTGNTIINFGGGGTISPAACGAIFIHNQWNFNISYNTINNNTGAGINHPTSNRGIWLFASSVGASCDVNNNTITIKGGTSATAINWCIDVELAQSGANGNTINVKNNQLLNCNFSTASTGTFTAIWLATAATTVNVTDNYIYGFTYSGTGTSQVITSQTSCGTLNILNNTIDSTVITAGSGTFHIIGVLALASDAFNVNGNNITKTIYNTPATAAKSIYGIFYNSASPVVNILDNTIDGITRNGVSAGGGGITAGICHSGGVNGTSTTTVKRNTISNIFLAAIANSASLYGIQLPAGTLICDSNTIFNLTSTGNVAANVMYGIYVSAASNNENYNYNTIYNFTHGGIGNTYGIYSASNVGVRTVSHNTIYGINGGGTVGGIYQSASTPSVFSNKIYNLSTSSASAVVSGIAITSTTAGAAQVYNNLISGLNASASNGGTTPTVRGIDLTSTAATTTLGIYHNTVYLNATSTGAAFSSTGIYHTYNATGTTAALDMRNNIIVNTSAANGPGLTSAFRRSAAGIGNFASTSNTNLLYAGTPSATNVIYYDGTTGDQTIADYKTRMAPREEGSVSEVVNFLSTTGSSPLFLTIDSTITTQIEATGGIISGMNKDYNGKIRAGFLGYTGNSGLPDLGAFEGNYTGNLTNQMVFDSANADQYTGVAVKGTNNVKILRVRVYTEKGYNALATTIFSLTTASTTSIPAITNAKIYYTASDSTFTDPQLFGSAVPASSYSISGSVKLVGGANYFWVTYDISATVAAGNDIDAAVNSITINGSGVSLINGDPTGSIQIKGRLSGNYNVGFLQTYPTITAALDDLTVLGVSGPVTLTLTDPLYNTTSGETFPLTFKTYAGSSAINTVTLVPNSGNIARIESANATATIDLNGASNIIIDGRMGIPGGNLVIANTTTTSPAVRFVNDASKNKILYVDLRANNATALTSANAGVVFFGTTTGANGNDSNTIRFCDIHEETGGNPSVCIASLGSSVTSATHNEGNVIDSCNIYNYYHVSASNAAISIGANNGSWKINGNHFYQTASCSFTGTATNRVLLIAPTTGTGTTMSGFEITNNFIGGNNASGTGTYFIGGTGAHLMDVMEISVGNGVPTSIQNNTITNFNDSTAATTSIAFVGMNVLNGNVNIGTIKGNLIGSRSVNGAISFTAMSTTTGGFMGLRFGGGSGNTYNVANNIVSGIDLYGNTVTTSPEFFGMNVNQGATINVTNNMIGDTTMLNSIKVVTSSSSSVSVQRVTGFFCNAGAAYTLHNITGNTVANIVNNFGATGSVASCTRGIFVNPTFAGTMVVSNNLIKEIQTASGETGTGVNATLCGICVNTTTTNAVSVTGNTIYSLKLIDPTNTYAAKVTGICFSGMASGANSVSKNLIHSISLENSFNANAAITGIEIVAGNDTVANNMVSLGFDNLGSSVTAACTINGILKNAGAANIYFNTVKIGGVGVASDPSRTYAFQRVGAGTDDVRNNIFINSRNSSGLGGGHLAVGLNNTTTLIQNNNIYKADSFGVSNGAGYLTLASWLTATPTLDVNSKDTIVNFASLTDLHLAVNMRGVHTFDGAVISGINLDFDGQTRSAIPYIGADEVTTHPLPVEFLGVAAVVKGDDVLVLWTTASEQNNNGFDIESSIDGSSFEYVGFVKGAGNSNRILNYNLTDAGAFARTHSRVLYYRLKQLDNNGAFTYSKVVRVENNAGNRNAVSVSPNPFTSEYTINVNVLDEGTSEVEMTDIQGRIVAKQTGTLIRGTNTILVNNISAIQSGVYFVKVTTNNETQVFKLVKE